MSKVKRPDSSIYSGFLAKINDRGGYSWINLLHSGNRDDFYKNEELSEVILNTLISNFKNKTDKWLCLEKHEIIRKENFIETPYYSIVEKLLKKHNQCDKFEMIDVDMSEHEDLSYKKSKSYYNPLPLQIGEFHKYLYEDNIQSLIFNKFDETQTQIDTFFMSFLGKHNNRRDLIFNFLKRNGFFHKGFVGYEPSNPLYLLHRKIDDKIDFSFNKQDVTDWREVSAVSNIYLRSFLNIIAESYDGDEHIHVSEKIDKSLVTMQPFIVFGAPYTLKSLKKIGFKTFGDFWDESYDEIWDFRERFDTIFKTILFIENEYGSNFKEILMGEKMRSILTHNYELSKKMWIQSHSNYFEQPMWDEIYINKFDLSLKILEFCNTE